MKKQILFLFFILGSAQAAQIGQVVVEQSQVYQYPQFSSKAIATLSKGDSVAVSNLPTEGFYKVRLPNGELGWVSGNDVLVGLQGGEVTPSKSNRASKAIESAYPEDEENQESDAEVSSHGDRFRFLLGYGLESLSYNGLNSTFSKVETLNYGSNLGLEFQWKKSENWYWAIRTEYLFTSSGDQLITISGTEYTQRMNQQNIPLQMGLVYTGIQSKKFRLGLGLYLGFAFSKTYVEQLPASGTGYGNNYGSTDPCGTGAIQMAWSLGKRVGLFAEGAYRYEKSGTLSATTLGTLSVPAFTIDYSGVLGRLGLEMKF